MFDGAKLQVILPATDLARAKAWYAEKLDLTPVEDVQNGHGARYEIGGVQFLLYTSDHAGTNQATAAGLKPTDFDAAVAWLKDRGVAFDDVSFGEFSTVDGVLTLPDGARGAWFRDSEGNIWSVADA